MQESIYVKEQRLLREYHKALDERRNYDASVIYKQLKEVREIIKNNEHKES